MKAELVAEQLRRWSGGGALSVGGRLPTEPDLLTRYGAWSASGHARVGLAGRVRTGTSAAVTEGFDRAAAALGIEVPPGSRVLREEWTTDVVACAAACRDLGVTAIFCHGDRDAAALLTALSRAGLRVPEDILVAYDEDVAELVDPPLTTVAPPKAELGALATELLLRLIADPATPAHRIELQPRLTVRASCAARRRARARSVAPDPDRLTPAEVSWASGPAGGLRRRRGLQQSCTRPSIDFVTLERHVD